MMGKSEKASVKAKLVNAHFGDLNLTTEADKSTDAPKSRIQIEVTKGDTYKHELGNNNSYRNISASIAGIITLIILFVLYADLRETQNELNELKALVYQLQEQISIKNTLAQIDIDEKHSSSTVELDPKSMKDKNNYGNYKKSDLRFKREVEVNNSTDRIVYPLLAHYVGGLPEYFAAEGGVIAPWFKDRFAAGEFSLNGLVLKEGKATIAISQSGLYLIYAQVYYSNTVRSNSFVINLLDVQNNEKALAICENPGGGVGESSCFTALAYYFTKGMKVQLRQRELNRHIRLRQGQSFFGLLLLNPSM